MFGVERTYNKRFSDMKALRKTGRSSPEEICFLDRWECGHSNFSGKHLINCETAHSKSNNYFLMDELKIGKRNHLLNSSKHTDSDKSNTDTFSARTLTVNSETYNLEISSRDEESEAQKLFFRKRLRKRQIRKFKHKRFKRILTSNRSVCAIDPLFKLRTLGKEIFMARFLTGHKPDQASDHLKIIESKEPLDFRLIFNQSLFDKKDLLTKKSVPGGVSGRQSTLNMGKINSDQRKGTIHFLHTQYLISIIFFLELKF